MVFGDIEALSYFYCVYMNTDSMCVFGNSLTVFGGILSFMKTYPFLFLLRCMLFLLFLFHSCSFFDKNYLTMS